MVNKRAENCNEMLQEALKKAGQVVLDHADELAKLLTLEQVVNFFILKNMQNFEHFLRFE